MWEKKEKEEEKKNKQSEIPRQMDYTRTSSNILAETPRTKKVTTRAFYIRTGKGLLKP